MLETVLRDRRTGAEMEEIADFGLVHVGSVGLQPCRVSLRIERGHGAFHLAVEVELGAGPDIRRVRAVTWPYSRRDRRDLTRALVDLHVVRAGPRPGVFRDDRSHAGRLLDSFTRRVAHGSYRFRSPLEGDAATTVNAEIVDVGDARTVTLTETTRRGQVAAHLPHGAFAGLCAALERYVAIV